MTAYTLLTPHHAKRLYGIHLDNGCRLILVDGQIWGRTMRLGSHYHIRPHNEWTTLDPFVTSPYDTPKLVEAALADGTLSDPAERNRREAEARAQREREAAERKAAEEAIWRNRAQEAVLAFQQGTSLEAAILDAMKWAKGR